MRFGIVAFIGLCVYAQTAFEVASVKPQPWTGNKGGVYVVVRGNTLNAEHSSLNDLVEFAYGLKDFQLSGGPAWAQRGRLDSSDLYQVVAKASGEKPPSAEEFRVMLQGLLAERFQLKVHHVEKEVPVYNLVVAKGGPNLVESATDSPFAMNIDGGSRGGPSRIRATHTAIEKLIGQLGIYAGRPVFDKTALTGFYDFEMEMSFSALSADNADTSGPSVFTALQKLGLKLEAGTAPFDTVVIDHAEKPSEN
jgi:uncharacterized protein (TIGR03435 family)